MRQVADVDNKAGNNKDKDDDFGYGNDDESHDDHGLHLRPRC